MLRDDKRKRFINFAKFKIGLPPATSKYLFFLGFSIDPVFCAYLVILKKNFAAEAPIRSVVYFGPMFHPNQRLGLLRERGAVWGRVRSGFPFGRGNSEGRTPSPKEPAAIFTLFSTPSLDANGTCIYGRGSWLSCMNSRPTPPPRP